MQNKKYVILFSLLFSVLSFAQDSTDSDVDTAALKSSHGTLELQSSVISGVWINGKAVGTTPFIMNIDTGWAVYSLRSPDYWSEVNLVNIKNGEKVLNDVQLKKNTLPTREVPDVASINDLKTLELMYDSLSNIQPSTESDSVCIAHFVADYPLPIFAPEPLNVDSPEYRSYYETYINERQLSFENWYEGCAGSVQDKLNIVLAKINELRHTQIEGFAPVVGGNFMPEDSTGLKGRLGLYFHSPGGRVDVIWDGIWEHDFLTGDSLIKSLTKDSPTATSFLTIQDETVWIPIENGFSRHFYKYLKLVISWNGLIINMDGKFILPDYILAQPLVKDWFAFGIFDKDSIVEIDTVKNQAVLAKIPAGTLNYKGKNVEIRAFDINTTEINQALYNAKCEVKDFGEFKGDSLPAHSVTWNEANSCCIALGGSLPTEAQWEYAARAGNPNKYIWGSKEIAVDYAIYDDNLNKEEPVKSSTKKANGWGLYDMFGNVAEWVKDDGGWSGKYRFLKGGSFKSSAKELSVEAKEKEDARYWGRHVGFRCVYKD